MQETEIELPAGFPGEKLPDLIERCADAEGLGTTLKGSLSRYPGCVHWHFKRGRERGTLEATYWPVEQRLWLSVQSGRTGEWTDSAVLRLQATLRSALETHRE